MTKLKKKIIINCDGGARGNPGAAAIGVLIRDEEDNVIESHKETIGETTNNVAEYRALMKALDLAAKHTKNSVQIFMDSELVVKQVKGEYKVAKVNLLPLYAEVKMKEKYFDEVSYTYVPRINEFQAKADELVNAALDEE